MPSVVLRNWKTVATTSILAFLATLGTVTPAHAHESVSEQYPRSGQTVSAGAVELSLVFTGDLLVLADASGIELELTDPSGQSVRLAERGCLTILQRSVGSSLELDQAGEYRVEWQVTAGDGHPLSESFTFFVENSSGFVAASPVAEITCAGNLLPDGSVVAPETDTANDEETTSEGTLLGIQNNVWLALLLGLALALVAALTYLLLKPRQSRANRN